MAVAFFTPFGQPHTQAVIRTSPATSPFAGHAGNAATNRTQSSATRVRIAALAGAAGMVGAWVKGSEHRRQKYTRRVVTASTRQPVRLQGSQKSTVNELDVFSAEVVNTNKFESRAEHAQQVIWRLARGNSEYSKGRGRAPQREGLSLLEVLVNDALRPNRVQVVVVACASVPAPVDDVFNAPPGEIMSINVFGCVCGPADDVVGSVEYALQEDEPPVVMVLASVSPVIEAAVRIVMRGAGRQDLPLPADLSGGLEEKELVPIQKIIPAARDALMRTPTATFDALCEAASKLNMWNTVENLLQSQKVHADVSSGKVQVHGAYLNNRTGKVQFLGRHPAEDRVLKKTSPMHAVRTAEDPPVPAQEALCALEVGNMRYAAGFGGRYGGLDHDSMSALAGSGQNPIAVVLGCADSRAPVEIMFDQQPGDLFVLRDAGNAVASEYGSVLGSAEYAITALNTKLVVVCGHSKCGAVTAAVNSVRQGDTSGPTANIGAVINNIAEAAQGALENHPSASQEEQVDQAIKMNVFTTIAKMVAHSDVIRDGLRKEEVMVVGAVYDISTGRIQWLGSHPEQERLVGSPQVVQNWRNTPYLHCHGWSAGPGAAAVIDRLREGNTRFVNGVLRIQQTMPNTTTNGSSPDVLLAGPSNVRMPLERIFDASPGEVAVQRCMGNLAGRPGGVLFSSLEYAISHYSPKVVVVVGHLQDAVIREALAQVYGAPLPDSAKRMVIDKVVPSVAKAVGDNQKLSLETSSGTEIQIEELAAELNALYTIEQLMMYSPIVRKAVKNGLELHCATIDSTSGRATFHGQHPLLGALTSLE